MVCGDDDAVLAQGGGFYGRERVVEEVFADVEFVVRLDGGELRFARDLAADGYYGLGGGGDVDDLIGEAAAATASAFACASPCASACSCCGIRTRGWRNDGGFNDRRP